MDNYWPELQNDSNYLSMFNEPHENDSPCQQKMTLDSDSNNEVLELPSLLPPPNPQP